MNILVTGASGFIGRKLLNALAGRSDVHLFALSRRSFCEDNVEMLQGDILDGAFVQKCFAEHEFDVVIHLAAITEHHKIVDEKAETLELTLRGTLNLLNAFNDNCRGGSFIYSSTGKVYGKTNEMPISEAALVNPGNILGKIKRIGEEVIDLCSVPDNRYLICRIFNIYGEWQKRSFVVPTIIDQLASGELKLGNMKDKRDYLYIDDLVEALIACVDNASSFKQVDYVNIGSGVPADVEEIVEVISELTGKNLSVQVEAGKLRKDETSVEYCDNSKLQKLANWKPKYSLREGLKKTLAEEGVSLTELK